MLERHARGRGRVRHPRVQLRPRDPQGSQAPEDASMREPYSFTFYTASWYRRSPYWQRTVEAGCTSWDLYNHMLIPTLYDDDEREYWHLVEHVGLWDVAVERQVEITGPDAARFTQLLTCRDLSRCAVGQCKYAPLIAPDGGIVNDPVLLRLGENHFWLSVADSDVLVWALGVAHGSGLDVTIREADVGPVQIQGPKSKDVMVDLFGADILEVPYYFLRRYEVDGMPVLVSRTGYTAELGYEIYLFEASRHGERLWDAVLEAGRPHGLAVIGPSHIRRIEGGILAYGADMWLDTNPYEVGMGYDWMVDLEQKGDFIGKQALARIKQEGVRRRRAGVNIKSTSLRAYNNHSKIDDIPVT